jgi:hypothetical protein
MSEQMVGKRRLFDKDVEIAKLNSVLVVKQAEYLSLLGIAVSFLVAAGLLDVQLFVELIRGPFQLLLAYAIIFLFVVMILAVVIVYVTRTYTSDIGKRAEYIDDVPNAEAAGAKWILTVNERTGEYKYALADGAIIEDFDESGEPRLMSRIYDPNMATALHWANGLGPPPPLPLILHEVSQRALLVHYIDGPLVQNRLLDVLSDKDKARRIDQLAQLCGKFVSDVGDANVRANLALRLWSGCLMAAKSIALETLSGPNTPEMRASNFVTIDALAAGDPIFRAGVEAAPLFKKLREELYSLKGVPQVSAVRRFA